MDSPSERVGRAQPTSAPASSIGTGFSSAYRQMADTARSAGVTSIGGGLMPSQPSFRQAENQSMESMNRMNRDARTALMETIAGPESNGRYDAIYGGSRFNDFSDHPRTAVTIKSGPNKGRKSTAAGKYQFTAPTWDEYAEKLQLDSFSPEDQERAAYELAKDRYRTRTGRNLETDLVSQNPDKIANIGKSLAGTWTSLPGGIEQGIGQNKFVQSFNDKYMGPTIPDRPSDVGGTMLAGLPSDGPVPSSRPQQPSQTAYVDPMVVKVDQPAQATPEPRVAQVDRFKEKYLGTPATGPTPAARPKVAEAPKELTTGQKIAAGAIDIGAGFIPVVGTGLGIVNAGLQLTGNQTIGQRLVAGLGEGTGEPPPPSQGSDRDYPVTTMETPPVEIAAAAPAPIIPPVQRFVSTYLRPTPRDKWSRA